MAIPDVDTPINAVYFPWEVVMKADRAAEKVQERMRRASAALQAAGVPFVVIGGNAVGIWVATRDPGAVRNTKDVDILLSRSDLQRASAALAKAGFDQAEIDGVTMFLERDDPMPSRAVHVVFAQERVRPHQPAEAPAVCVGRTDDQGVPAIGLAELVTMKLIANRNIDRVHIEDLHRVGLLSGQVIDQIPESLQSRLRDILANPDG